MSTASYGIAVNGDILLQEGLVHIGDTNTKIRFPSNDTISFETTGGERSSYHKHWCMLEYQLPRLFQQRYLLALDTQVKL